MILFVYNNAYLYLHKYLWLTFFTIAALAFEPSALAQLEVSSRLKQKIQQEEEDVAAIEADDDDDSDELALEMRQKQIIGMANPASVNCTKNGGTLKEETKPNGDKFSVCYFSSGGVCEVWALFRRECPPEGVIVSASASPSARYCAIIGGRFVPGIPNASDTDEENGSCLLPHGGATKAQDLWSKQIS